MKYVRRSRRHLLRVRDYNAGVMMHRLIQRGASGRMAERRVGLVTGIGGLLLMERLVGARMLAHVHELLLWHDRNG